MPADLAYRPADLSYEELQGVDEVCFPDEPLSTDAFADLVKMDFWTARRDGRLVGYSYVKVNPDLAWIGRIGVAPTDRNQGVGSQLMAAMLEHCRGIPRSRVILYVQRDNPSAIHLYEKHGFRTIEESFQYIVPIEPLLAERVDSRAPAIAAIAVTDVPAHRRPVFESQWSDLAEKHDPPKTHVLVFHREGEGQVGYCRFCPGFPGCFPFELVSPTDNLLSALDSLRPLLSPLLSSEHRVLKLTFTGPEVARACDLLGFELNYRLYKMVRDWSSA